MQFFKLLLYSQAISNTSALSLYDFLLEMCSNFV